MKRQAMSGENIYRPSIQQSLTFKIQLRMLTVLNYNGKESNIHEYLNHFARN